MSSLRQNIPHVQQPSNTNWCGAACLKMVYEIYNIPCTLEEIWDAIKGTDERTYDENCRLYLMGRHVKQMNLNPCIISTPNPIATLDACFKGGIHVISLFRPNLQGDSSHFVVITGWDKERIFFNDPWDDATIGKNKALPLMDWLLRCQATETSQLIKSNTMVLIGNTQTATERLVGIHEPYIKSEPVDIFPTIKHPDLQVLCLEHDCWF